MHRNAAQLATVRDAELNLLGLARLLRRTLPLLRGVRRHLALLASASLALLVFSLVAFLLLAPALWNGALQGKTISPVSAQLMGLDPALFAGSESLPPELRRLLASRLTWAMAGSFLGVMIASMLVIYYGVWILQRLNQSLRLQLVDRLQALSLRFHESSPVGDAIYRTYQDSAMVTQVVQALLLTPAFQLVQYAACVAVTAVFSPLLALFLALIWPPLLWLGRAFGARMRAGFRAARATNSELTSRIQESLSGVRTIKAYGLEQAEQARFEAASHAAFAAARGARGLLAGFGVLNFWVLGAALIGATAVASLATRSAEPTWLSRYATAHGVSGLSALAAATGLAVWTLGLYNAAKGVFSAATGGVTRLFSTWARAQDIAIGLDRVYELLELEPEVQDAPDAQPLPPLRDKIAFRGVSFGYRAERPALIGVSFEAPVGGITALVGPTGAGKSTVLALLMRLFDPERGAVEIDGLDLRRAKLSELRAAIAIALQENVLFAASVRENIAYARGDASDSQVRAAARIACADEFIAALPDGYDTLLGERGARLSTGQRQRLTIARALLRDAPILLLDEPTAALDPETERRLVLNLAQWARGRCVFLVTHRIPTLRLAQRIVYLERGQVVECGTPEELLARPGSAFRALVEAERAERLGAA
jgi:ABC-type multidrug transport system fused ATPase/permease subunit